MHSLNGPEAQALTQALRDEGGDLQAQLRDQQIMLTSALRLAGLGSWIWDRARDRLTWSEETYRVLHLRPENFEATPESFFRRVHPEDRAALKQAMEQVRPAEPHCRYRYRLTGDDGRERLIEGDGEGQFAPDGTLLRLVGTVMDVTGREREREALRASEERFRCLTELSSDWYWQQDTGYRFTDFSGGSHSTLDRRRAHLGQCRWELPECMPLGTTWEEHRAALDARQPFRDLQLRIGSGAELLYVSVSGAPMFDAAGTFLGYRGTATDITRRMQDEKRLRELNASLRMAVRLGRIGVWSLDLPARSFAWWEGGRIVHGPDGQAAADIPHLLQRAEASQRAGLAAAFEACIVQATAFDLEVQLVAGAYPRKWVRLIGEPQVDADGQVLQVQGTVQDVTERRLAAERAREMGSRLVATLDGVSDAFVTVNRDWQFSYLNQEAERVLRRSRDELLGRSIWEEYPGQLGTRFERAYRSAMSEGEVVEFEEYYEGLGQWFHVKAYPSPQGLAIYFRDVTDRRSIQEALVDSQEQLRNLFENTIDGVLYTGPDERVVRVNPAACAMLGRTEDELRGSLFAALVAPAEQGLPVLWEQRATQGRASGTLMLRRADGTEFPAEVSSAEYPAPDGSSRAFVVWRDISRRVRAEEALLQLNAELEQRVCERTAELEAANADLQAFAHSVAHDLQSPAAAIDAFSQMLEGTLPQPLPQRAAHYLGRIRGAARKTSEYVQGMLALARVSQSVLSPTLVDLSAIARDVLTQLAEGDPGRQVEWEVQDEVRVLGDTTLLRMVLDNLLGNAWKFTRGRMPARIAFGAEFGVDGRVTCRVRDNGAGFAMAEAHKLFGHFQRLHSQAEFPGTGIGLANVHRIVSRHGGRIWAEAAPGQGACFQFTLHGQPQAQALPAPARS